MATKKGSRGRCIAGQRQKKVRKPMDRERMLVAWADRLNKVATRHMPISPVMAKTQIVQMQESYRRITRGDGAIDDASILAVEVNMCLRLCESNFAGSGDYLAIAQAAHAAMLRLGERMHRTGRVGFDGDGINALASLLDLREQQLLHPDNRVGIESEAFKASKAEIESGNCIRFGDEVAA
jgi:hypothetical protein